MTTAGSINDGLPMRESERDMVSTITTVIFSAEEIIEIGKGQNMLGITDLNEFVKRAAIYYARVSISAMEPSSPLPPSWNGEEPAWALAYRASVLAEASAPQAAPPASPVAAPPQAALVAAPPIQASATPPPAVAPPTMSVAAPPAPLAPASPPSLAARISADEVASLREAERRLRPEERTALRFLRDRLGADVPSREANAALKKLLPSLTKTPRSVYFKLKALGLIENRGDEQAYCARIIPGLWQP
jgi:hypothetical protein